MQPIPGKLPMDLVAGHGPRCVETLQSFSVRCPERETMDLSFPALGSFSVLRFARKRFKFSDPI